MKQFKYKLIYVIFASLLLFAPSCTDDLNQYPHEQLTSESVYKTVDGYRAAMAGVYGGVMFGNPNIDMRFVGMRGYFSMQEYPTDEVVYSWPSDNMDPLQTMQWTTQDIPTHGFYYDLYYDIALCNEFLRNATDEKVANFSSSDQTTIIGYRNDVRFIRAMIWMNILDLFGGNVPFVTENDPVGSFMPDPTNAQDLFNYIESELKTIGDLLPDNGSNEYGRPSKGAAWSLLTRLYLNADTYIKIPKYTDCITYCKKVFEQGYTLEPVYDHLFNAQNNLRTNEIIFPITSDMTNSISWSGSIFLISGALGGSALAADYGVDAAWGNMRTRPECVGFFPDPSGATDKRAKFYSKGQSLTISSLSNQSEGYLVTKYNNLNDDGTAATGKSGVANTDWPVIRLAEIYLNYTEAVLRGGNGGDRATALKYVNEIRDRAWGVAPGAGSAGDISDATLNLDWLLTERGRELHWECLRRTDLIRYGKFTGNSYIWSWKGGVKNGTATNAKYNLFPIPASEIAANKKLSNPTY